MATALSVAACGSSSSSAGSGGGAASASVTAGATSGSTASSGAAATASSSAAGSGVAQAVAAVAAARPPIAGIQANGAPFNAKPAAQGKVIGVVAGTTVVPLYHQVVDPFITAAKLLGMTVRVCDGQNFSLSEESRCISSFTDQHVNAIALQSVDPSTVSAPLAAAHKAGILILASNTATEDAPLAPNIDAQVSFPYIQAAQLEAQTVIAMSGGKAHPLLITSNDYVNSPPMKKVILKTFADACGSNCTPIVRDVPIADWAQRLSSTTQSTLLANPDIDYIIPLFDAEVTNVAAGVRTTHSTKIKIVTFNGSKGIVDLIKQSGSPLVADVGTWPAQVGWVLADAAARLFAGQRDNTALRNARVAPRIFDQTNINSLNLNEPNTWYGNFDLESFFKKQWMLQ